MVTVDIHYSQIQIIIRVATTVGLVRGYSSTYVCTVNQMLLWSDVAFWQYSARKDGSYGTISDNAYHMRQEAEPDTLR